MLESQAQRDADQKAKDVKAEAADKVRTRCSFIASLNVLEHMRAQKSSTGSAGDAKQPAEAKDSARTPDSSRSSGS